MMNVVRLSFSYRGQSSPVLRDVNFQIPKGKITSLIGPNGSGKSTLFRLLNGRYKPQKGAVWLDGRPLAEYSGRERARKMAMLFQHQPEIRGLTVRELVETGRTPYHRWGKGRHDGDVVDEVLKWTSLTELEQKRVEQLSGGQKQRVWLAQALAQEPDLLLLDEPTVYLDIEYQVEILLLLRRLNRERGLTICLIHHDLTQVMEISDHVVALKDGTVFAEGSPQEVLTRERIERLFNIRAEMVSSANGNAIIHYIL
jgi:ABC transporter.